MVLGKTIPPPKKIRSTVRWTKKRGEPDAGVVAGWYNIFPNKLGLESMLVEETRKKTRLKSMDNEARARRRLTHGMELRISNWDLGMDGDARGEERSG